MNTFTGSLTYSNVFVSGEQNVIQSCYFNLQTISPKRLPLRFDGLEYKHEIKRA